MTKDREPRDKVLSLRLTEAEYEDLNRRAAEAGETVSDYVRGRLLDGGWRQPAPLPIGSGPVSTTTAAAKANIIWLGGGEQDGGTLTIRAA